MIIGCPTEVKAREHRVGIVPAAARELTSRGHTVVVQKDAGIGSGVSDADYQAAGAIIVDGAADVWSRSDMIVKVKEPLPQEYDLMREGQMLFTYLHLAAVPDLTKALVDRNITGVAYETIDVDGKLPLLKPMSEVAGKMSIQVGAWCLEKERGGKGVLLGGVPGVPRGRVTVIGGGVVGVNAAKIAVGMGAGVTIVDNNLDRLEYLDDVFLGRVQTLYSTPTTIVESCASADLIIGAVLVPGARAPNLITRGMLADMEPGTVIVDVAVDQGGCVETSKVTTHDAPTFTVDGVVHYGVANMPGAVARTSTFALSHSTIRFMVALADNGVDAIRESVPLQRGVNTMEGHVTYEAVAQAHDLDFKPVTDLL